MASGKSSSSVRMIWTVLAIVLVGIAGFVGGFYLGNSTSDTVSGFYVVDDYGRTVEVEGIPDRIVSCAPTPTEILFAVGAGDQVVGVDDYSDYPAEAAALPKIGSYTLNLEAIIALQPDLIVSSDLVPLSQLEQLEDQGIPYFIFATRTLEMVFKDISMAGVITGHVTEAEALVESLQERTDAVTAKTLAVNVSKPKVYLEYYPMWTYGPGSFGDDLMSLAGGANIAANTSSEYPMVTDEFVIAQNPDIIIYTTGVMSTTTSESIATRPGWDGITAVVEDQIYGIDDNLVSRYGPRVVDGLELLAEIIHPELFS